MDGALGLRQVQQLRLCEVTSCDLNINYLLALGSRDKSVRILEWKPGLGFVDVFYSPLTVHKYPVSSVRFSPKGTILASSSRDGTAVLIDVLKGTKIMTVVQENTSNINFCEFAFDCSNLMTAADDGTLCFWNLADRRQIRCCRLHEEEYTLRGVSASPDSQFLLSVDSCDLLKVWYIGDVLHGQPGCFFRKKNIHDDVLCCGFSPVKDVAGGTLLKINYTIVTGGADGFIKIWGVTIQRRETPDTFTCHLTVVHILNHGSDVLSVRFNSEGNYIVSTGLNNVVKLWEVDGGQCVGSLRGHSRYVTSAVFSKDSLLLVTGSIDRSLIVWSLTGNLSLDSELLTPCCVSCHFTNVNVISYNSRGDQEKAHKEFTVKQKLTFPSVINGVRFFSREDILAAVGGQGTAQIWRKSAGGLMYEQTEILREHGCGVNHVDASTCGGKIVSCSVDGVLVLWDVNMSLGYKMKPPDSSGGLRTCRFSPDSRYIVAAGDDQKVFVWDANSLEFLRALQPHENTLTALSFTPDGEYLVTVSGTEVVLQNVNKDEITAKIGCAHDLGVLCCDFSSAFGSGTEFGGSNRRDDVSYLLATGGNDSLVKLWKVSSSDILPFGVLSGHGGTVNCVEFSPSDASVLASCSSDVTVRIWDTKCQRCLHVLNHHHLAVTTCSFSKDSTLLATGSLDKCVFILKLTSSHEPKVPDQNPNKLLENWSPSDISNWFLDIGQPEIAAKIEKSKFSGRELLTGNDDTFSDLFDLKTDKEENQLKTSLLILKKSLTFPFDLPHKGKTVPHEFLCPITHLIMKDPVICTDGYTYDRAAITEWFLSGKSTSPITKECLSATKLLPYSALKINIHKFLTENES